MHEIHNHPEAFKARPSGPRTYKVARQRARGRVAGIPRKPSPGLRSSEDATMEPENTLEPEEPREPEEPEGPGEPEEPEGPEEPAEPQQLLLSQLSQSEPPLDRSSLCLPNFDKDSIVHGGEEGFGNVLSQYFPSAESNASERLVALKTKLRDASTHDFWSILMEDMCDITGSQCGFVAKRMLVDDQDSAVEMPDLGEPGSCLMGVAFYINNGNDVKELYRDYRYHAYGTPCAYMKYDKIFVVPERLAEFTPNNPNTLPWTTSEAFIGVPLFADGKCFAHFGMVWSSVGASRRKLSWSFLEMFMHSLEDMILQRIMEGRGFVKELAPPDSDSAKIIPLSAITASQSLKPYARSLSHELRTPMQGVVGMLDIMYSTVLDAIANLPNEQGRSVFEELKGHIEVVQDSSRRAVEAADNVVHAYDVNMMMPDTPLSTDDDAYGRKSSITSLTLGAELSGNLDSEAKDSVSMPPRASLKRERDEEPDFHPGPPLKRMLTMANAEIGQTSSSADLSTMISGSPYVALEEMAAVATTSPQHLEAETGPPNKIDNTTVTPASSIRTRQRIVTRDLLRTLVRIVSDALRSGHPTSQVHTQTKLGETIEVTTLGPRGDSQDRTIHLNVEPDVPEVIVTEAQHLQFSLQKVVDNAIKFTESGSITITVKLSKNAHLVEIWVVDTGCGITEASKSLLFQPHFQEEASISRSRDGLGLSLFNAKAHIRRTLGGDVTLERSATEGPTKGSEFLIRVPIATLEASGTNTPVVGQSPPLTPQPYRPSPLSDLDKSSTPDASTTTPVSCSKTSQPCNPKSVSRKRVAFNPNLASDYPLNILIAEDNAINRNVAVGSLKKLGYSKESITVAFDGVEAVQHYEASLSKAAKRFNVVLMDIWMPNMDGYEATSKILMLSQQAGETATVLAVTADITGECAAMAQKVGMKGFLAKPYKVLDIEHLIVKHCPKRTAEIMLNA